jgi:Trypsin-like peptidase domain
MGKTPRSLLAALDRVTANLVGPETAAPQMLGFAASRHMARVQSVFDDDNVVGAGVAEKSSDGESLGELSLVFYVRKKLPRSELDPRHLVPPVIADPRGRALFTDVVEVGDIVPEVNSGRPPLQSGFSIGHVAATAGTLGAFVKKNRKLYVLSNSHVLAQSGLAAIGDGILYPGQADGGLAPADIVAKLHSFAPFVVNGRFVNKADAALAEIAAPLAATLIPGLFGSKTPLKIGTPQRGMTVVKRGRTTGDTQSVVRDTDFRIFVNYPGVGPVGFTGQVRCDRYTQPGDSGSIVIDKASGAVVGLHFAGSDVTSVFAPIRAVINALKFTF